MEPPYDIQKWKLDIFRDKLRHSLSARFYLRFHISMIIAFSILCGWFVDVAMLRLGAASMPFRFVVANVAGYLAFLLGTYLWVEYSGIREYVKHQRAEELVGDDVSRVPRYQQNDTPAGLILLNPFEWAIAGPEGCLVWACLLAFLLGGGLLFLFFGGQLVIGAASFFAEIVVELLLAAGLLRGIRRIESDGWVNSVIGYTKWWLAFSLVCAIGIGWGVQQAYPKAKTMGEAWTMYQNVIAK